MKAFHLRQTERKRKIMNCYGNRLNASRKESKMSMEMLRRKLEREYEIEVSVSQISLLCAGKRIPSIEIVEAFHEIFGIGEKCDKCGSILWEKE